MCTRSSLLAVGLLEKVKYYYYYFKTLAYLTDSLFLYCFHLNHERSKASGFLLPLSGGADSSAVATIVRTMCGLAVDAANGGNIRVLEEVKRLMKPPSYPGTSVSLSITSDSTPSDPSSSSSLLPRGQWNGVGVPTAEQLCECVLSTVYMGTQNSSAATRSRAARLSEAIGAYHVALNFDTIVDAVFTVFAGISGRRPRYLCHGGSHAEDIALQNVQARLRMVMAYLCAQLLPWVRGRTGYLLVLGSANVDESLRGYMTKYDCSSADINPIGGICKEDLKRLLLWGSETFKTPVLAEILYAPPSVCM